MTKKDRGLGRGLDALFSNDINQDELQVTEVSLDEVVPCSKQPRKTFNEESLKELADSIKEHGLLQPILVRMVDDNYEIIAGERRWRAAKIAGLEFIPALVRDLEDKEVAEISLIENLQREDLPVIEEAFAYKNMMEEYQYTQELLAERIGKSRAHIANTIRLLSLPPEILELLEMRKLSAGHARTLLALESREQQLMMAKEIVEGKLSVRKTEERVKKKSQSENQKKSIEIKEIEDFLQKHFGTRAEIQTKKKGGRISISYYDEDDLDRILDLFGIRELS